ncbi:MAG: 5-deoxy-glucuronate isomerase [Chloroflexota bacterium]|nr:5-deoxy-glucuronate isomerase [Chloroflexota bacterium]
MPTVPVHRDLVIRAPGSGDAAVTPEDAGWRYIGFEKRHLDPEQRWTGRLAGSEGLFLVLGGRIAVTSNAGRWPSVGGRSDVFAGGTHALYLPLGSEFEVTAVSAADVALGLARAERQGTPRLIEPGGYAVETRGAGVCTRMIRHIVPPGFDAHRLLAVEVYTPSGNWSSYPPHKHDTDAGPREAVLEEIYYHQQSDPRGFAFQRLYTPDGEVEAAAAVRHGDLMLIPRGYHGPVAQAPGYEGYYLNVLAGDRRTMANSDDPDHAWIRESWARGEVV